MGSNNFLIILFAIFFINMISVEGDDEKAKDDLPKTIWEFIYTDWKTHLDSHMVDLPDLYKLFLDGWVPEDPPKEKSKRSFQKTINYEASRVEEGNMEDIANFRKWINDFIERRKYTRFIENDHLESPSEKNYLNENEAHNNIELTKDNILVNEGRIKMYEDEEIQNQNNSIDINEKLSNNLLNSEQRILEEKEFFDEKVTCGGEGITLDKESSTHKTMNEDPKVDIILDSKEIISPRQSVQLEIDESQGSKQDRNIYKTKRSIVEEVETPTYCKFFDKCILSICNCNNLKQIF